jgi:uncharacterized protein
MRILTTLSVLLLSSLCLSAQLSGNLLKVQGQSVISETPEDMTINITVKSKDSVYEKCSDKLIARYNKLIYELVQAGIEKDIIQTGNIDINEIFNWEDRTRKFEGYNGTISIYISSKYDQKRLNSIIKSLKSNDLNLSYNVLFQLSTEQKDKLLQKSIENAIKDATNKAEIISHSMGLKLTGIKEINFGYVSPEIDNLTQESLAFCVEGEVLGESTTSDLMLNPQKMEVVKSIGIIWEIGK